MVEPVGNATLPDFLEPFDRFGLLIKIARVLDLALPRLELGTIELECTKTAHSYATNMNWNEHGEFVIGEVEDPKRLDQRRAVAGLPPFYTSGVPPDQPP